MANLWDCGFGLQSTAEISDNSTTAPTFSTSTVMPGNYSQASMVTSTSASTCWGSWWYDSAVNNKNIYFRAYVYPTGNPDVACNIIQFTDTSYGVQSSVTLNTDGTVKLITELGSQLGSNSSALTLNAWNQIELRHSAATNPGFLELRLNGVFVASGSNAVRGSAARVRFGLINNNCTCTLYWAEISMNDASGTTSEIGWLGTSRLFYLVPNGAGDTSGQWTVGGSTPAATEWQSVDETIPDFGQTFIYDNTSVATGHISEFTVGIQTAGNINPLNDINVISSISLGIIGNSATAISACSIVPRIKGQASGTVSEGTTTTFSGGTWMENTASTPSTYPLIQYTNPQSGNAWVSGDLANIQIGVHNTNGSGNSNSVQITKVWGLVRVQIKSKHTGISSITGIKSITF